MAGSFSATPAELDSGGLLLAFGIESLLPTLPDPYAANFLPLSRNFSRNQPVCGRGMVEAPRAASGSGTLESHDQDPCSRLAPVRFRRTNLQVERLSPTQERQPFGDTGVNRTRHGRASSKTFWTTYWEARARNFFC